MSLVAIIKEVTAKAIEDIYKLPAFGDDVLVNQTKPEFEGDYTVVLFAFVKKFKTSPEKLGNEIGTWLIQQKSDLFTGFNVIKGFLNLTIADSFFIDYLQANKSEKTFITSATSKRKIMVEYSSPNTNKPLHLGHLRNNFLGWSVAQILKATGNDVMKTCIANDRGIHICKSMRAWKDFGNGTSSESTGIKGDHFVGDFYVLAENNIKDQARQVIQRMLDNDYSDFEQWERDTIQQLVLKYQRVQKNKNESDTKKINDEILEQARKVTYYMKICQQMLVDWENGKPEVIDLWKTMNNWVYKGFDETYKRIGTDFDKIYYESETYLPGKSFVEMGLEKGILYQKEDGSVWIDLTDEGLDEKLLLRGDGTSVYITQDLGLAQKKYEDYPYDQSIYVIADEQNYHMKVLKLILQKMDMPYAYGIYHLSYGLVELPSGRMKTREGTVVDADDIVAEMVNISAQHTQELGKVKDFTEEELKELYDIIGLGALKFFILRVDPKKRMVFNPEESIDFHGFTGPFIQYTHARIKSILRREQSIGNWQLAMGGLLKLEKELLLMLEQYPSIIKEAANEYNPSVIAIYIYNIAKTYNSFYTEHSVLNAESEEKKNLRSQLCELTANVIASGMSLLGIRVPERM